MGQFIGAAIRANPQILSSVMANIPQMQALQTVGGGMGGPGLDPRLASLMLAGTAARPYTLRGGGGAGEAIDPVTGQTLAALPGASKQTTVPGLAGIASAIIRNNPDITPEELTSQIDTIGEALSKYQNLSGPGTNAAPAESRSPGEADRKGANKPITKELVAKFLQQAGGDKEKARQLAREAGYSF
jgi:hypothetical protein